MKLGAMFFAGVVALLIYIILKSDPARVMLGGDGLKFYTKECEYVISVEQKAKEREMVEEVGIERILLELPNDDLIYYETISLPPKYSFDKPYEHIIEEIFKSRFKELFSKDGFVYYQGEDFDVALFYKTKHELVLIYPANDLRDALMDCFVEGRQERLKKFGIEPKKSQWSPKLIIIDNIINKDI
jgi:hypothetical protein